MFNHTRRIYVHLVITFILVTFNSIVFAEQGDWLVRLRGIVITPDDSSGLVSSSALGPLAGTGVGVDNNPVPELDVTYMFHKHWGVEVIAGISEHTVSFKNSGAPVLGVLADGQSLFNAWVLPPTVTLQYHILPDKNIRPYVGLGVNYTAFLWPNATSSVESLIGPVSVGVDHSWGFATQAGIDIELKNNWFINLDVKYIDMSTVATLVTTTAASALQVDLDVDPWVFGAGIGYRF